MSLPDYPRGRLIAHAGGLIDGIKYSNSADALEQSARCVGLVELDVCRAADGLIVAHDGLEKSYGLAKPFGETTVAEFRETKFKRQYRVMAIEDLLLKTADLPSSVILDIKSEEAAEYREDVSEVARQCVRHGKAERVIVQVYNVSDFDAARSAGFENVVLALWKSFGNVRTPECLACIDYCIRNQPSGFFALSIAARHFWRDGKYNGSLMVSHDLRRAGMIFLHGQPAEAEERLLADGFGLFTHNAVEWSERLGLISGSRSPP